MIPAARLGSAGISRWAGGLAILAAAGCLAPDEPTLATLARERRDGVVFAERDQRRRELQLAEQETRDLLAAIAVAKARSVEAAAALRALRQQLVVELARLAEAERDLADVQARLQTVESAREQGGEAPRD